MSTHDLISALQGEGQLEHQGAFELDREKAREKMQKFQLNDPHAYVLEFIQVAHLLGATRIDVLIDADEVDIRFDGDALSAEQLNDIYNAAFRPRAGVDEQAMRHLAIGVSAAQAMSPSVILVEMGEHRLVIRPDAEDLVEAREVADGPTCRLYLKEQFRPSHLREFFQNLKGDLAEKTTIRDNCKYSPVPIWMDGEVINHGMRLGQDATSIVAFRNDDEYGLLGIVRDDRLSQVYLLQNGVLITAHLMPAKLLAIEAVVSSSRLTTNLSQSAFVQDKAWEDLFGRVLKTALYDSLFYYLESLLDHHSPYDLPESLHKWLLDVVLQLIDESNWYVEHKQQRPEQLERLLPLIERVPVVKHASALPEGVQCNAWEMVSIETIRSHSIGKKHKKLYTSAVRYVEQTLPDVGLVVVHEQAIINSLATYLNVPSTQCTKRLKTAYAAKINRERWLNSPHLESLSTRYRVCVESKSKGVNVCWAWTPSVTLSTSTVYVKDSHTLRVHKLSYASFPVRLLFAGKLDANSRFDDVKRNQTFKKHVLHALTMFPELVEQWAETQSSSHGVISESIFMYLLKYVKYVYAGKLIDALKPFFELPESFWSSSVFNSWYGRMTAENSKSPWMLTKHRDTLLEGRPGVVKAVSLFGSIGHLPMFPTLGVKVLTLAQVASALVERQTLAFVDEDVCKKTNMMADPAILKFTMKRYGKGADVLVLGGSNLAMLRCFITHASWLVNVDDVLVREMGRAQFMAKPKTRVAFSGRESAIHGDVDEHGVFCITNVLQPREHRRTLSIEWLHKGRFLCRTQRPIPFGTIEARVDHIDIMPNNTWDGIANTPLVDFLELHICTLAQRRLVRWCRSQEIKSLAPASLLELWQLTVMCRRRHLSLSKSKPSLSSVLAHLNMFLTTGDDLLTLSQVEDTLSKQGGRLYTIFDDEEVFTEKLLEPTDMVLKVPRHPKTLNVLGQLFDSNMIHVAKSVEVVREIEQAKVRFYKRSLFTPLKDDFLFSKNIKDAQWTLDVMVPSTMQTSEAQSAAHVIVLHEERVLFEYDHPLLFGQLSVVVRHDSAAPSFMYDGWRDQSHLEALNALIEETQLNIFYDIMERIEQNPEEEQSALPIWWSYVHVVTELFVQKGQYELYALFQLMMQTPLFPSAQGQWLTLDSYRVLYPVVVPVVSPGEMSKHKTWPEDPVLLDLNARDVLHHFFTLRTFKPSKPARRVLAPLKAPPTLDPVVVDASSTQTQSVSSPLAPSVEEIAASQLREAISTMLLEVRGESRVLLGDVFLDNMRIVPTQDVLTDVRVHDVNVSGDHPMSVQCVETPQDETALAFLASSVYSAINAHDEAITDEHEIAFQSLFIHHMVQVLGV